MAKILFVVFSFYITSYASPWLWEYGKATKPQVQHTSPFVLTVWNIYKGGYDGVYQDLDELVRTSDFVLMQEFLLNTPQTDLVEWIPNTHWALAKSFESGGHWTGVATASRWHPHESVPVRSPDTEPFTGTPKMSLISKYKMAHKDLWIVNLHGLNFNIGHGAFKKQIDDILEKIKTHKGPLIFAGDFNTWAEARMEYLIQKTKAQGLSRVDLESPMGFFATTLDHIFYRSVRLIQADVLQTFKTSDHLPLQIIFEL